MGLTKLAEQPDEARVFAIEIECVTQAERHIPGAAPYLAVCNGRAEVIATSPMCPRPPEEPCGGHPLCRPCLDLGRAVGWIVQATL